MGGNCSVAVKDKHLPNPAQLDVPLSTCRNTRYSPTWSFRCDNRTHIEVVMDSSPQISHHPNSGNEVKSEFLTEAERLSERAGPSTAFQLQKGETPIKNGSSRMATHDSAADRSNGSTSSPKRKNSSPKPAFLAPSASDTMITFSVPSMPSPSHKADPSSSRGRRLPADPTSSKKAACQSPDSRIPSVQSLNEDNSPEGRQSFVLSVGGSHGGSSNGWSMRTFSELVASSNRERWSFESDNLTPSSTAISSSNDHQQACNICSTPLTDYCIVAVLFCGHLYHAGCLEKMTSEIDQYDPPCPLCTHGQKSAAKLFKKSEAKAKNRPSSVGAADDDGKTLLYDRQRVGGLRNGARFPFNLRRYFSFSRPSRLKSQSESTRKKGFWRRRSSGSS
ncbi:uncharacterized protein LOC141825274 [Curcuma longa]|uniref:uncharacterized protein LOC141825274 n=1 Tax=Curcuma longa TaxID=136217 RepID=UPI003D9DD949